MQQWLKNKRYQVIVASLNRPEARKNEVNVEASALNKQLANAKKNMNHLKHIVKKLKSSSKKIEKNVTEVKAKEQLCSFSRWY